MLFTWLKQEARLVLYWVIWAGHWVLCKFIGLITPILESLDRMIKWLECDMPLKYFVIIWVVMLLLPVLDVLLRHKT